MLQVINFAKVSKVFEQKTAPNAQRELLRCIHKHHLIFGSNTQDGQDVYAHACVYVCESVYVSCISVNA